MMFWREPSEYSKIFHTSSVNVEHAEGRRNRKHLILSPDFHPEPEPEGDSDVTGYQHSPADADPGCPPMMSSPQSPKTYPERASSSTEASPDPYVTRSCRTVRPPERLDL
ncbi:hypothetical protein AVEN_272117-1 [Araneus ventricosus]|uniref:Uncharacterized protein n=1 Tax=Araneus ventricosus TaxID=182803 RepID=A0A4Y2KAA3_ARAVE|nr:hypothetical protein AVEN_272117-1 [Araneus ventricosus]